MTTESSPTPEPSDSEALPAPEGGTWWPDCLTKSRRPRRGLKAYVHPYLMLGFGLLILPLGFFFHGMGRHLVRRSPPIEHWKTVRGEITKTWMVYKVSTTATSETTWYFPSATYTYTVDGKTYRSDRIRYRGIPYYRSLSRAEARLRRWEDEPQVKVYYNPRYPSQAVIEKRSFRRVGWVIRVGGIGVAGMGGLIFLTGIFFLIRCRRLRRSADLPS